MEEKKRDVLCSQVTRDVSWQLVKMKAVCRWDKSIPRGQAPGSGHCPCGGVRELPLGDPGEGYRTSCASLFDLCIYFKQD